MRIFPVPSYTGDYIKALRWADIKDATTALDYVANFASYGVFDIVEIDSALGVIE